MRNILVGEDDADVTLMKYLLDEHGNANIEYFAAGSLTGAGSLARSFLTASDTKVAVVVDADSTDPNLIEERKRFLRWSLGQIAESDRWRVFVAEPQTEGLFFHDRGVLEELVQHKVNDTDFVAGQFNSERTLDQISGVSRNELYSRLSSVNLEPLKQDPNIKDLRQFFLTTRRKAAA